MHFLQAINSDISVLIVCNKTGGKIKGDIKKKKLVIYKNYTDMHGQQNIKRERKNLD